MTHLRSLWFLLFILAGMLCRAPAQVAPKSDTLEDKFSRSHLLDPDKFGLRGVAPEDLFKRGLNKIRAKEVLENYKKQKGLAGKQLDDFIRENPDLIKDYLKNFKTEQLPAELRQKLQGKEAEFQDFIRSLKPEDFQRYAKEAEGLGSLPGSGGPSPGAPPAPPPVRPGEPTPAPSSGPDHKGAEPAAPDPSVSGTDPEEQKATSALGRWLLKVADRFKDLDPSLRDSPALRRAIRELSRKVEGADERWQELDRGANTVAEKWARLGQSLPLDRLWPEKGFSWPRSLTPESFPRWHLPETGPRLRLPAPPPGPPAGTPDMTQGDGWRALGMLAALAVLGFVLWRILTRAQVAGLHGGAGAWKLGPWPVHPAAVQTREELIRAFEYLSVLRLGPAARHWHHWAIASGLGRLPGAPLSGGEGGKTPTLPSQAAVDCRRAAEQLASLYERARYAPSGESLPESAMATARRDLCLLAGVSVS